MASSSPVMSQERLHPSGLKEALSVTPLLHLIPRQDIAPLLSSAIIDPVPTRADDVTVLDADSNMSRLRTEINSNPVKYQKVIDFLVDDFNMFDDPELHDITFKKPIIAGATSRVEDVDKLQLPPLEKRLFNGISSIQDECLKDFDIESASHVLKNDDSSLNLRTYEGSRDDSKLEKHNKTFTKKFDKLYNKIKTDSREPSPQPSAPPHSSSNDDSQRSLVSKRPPDNDCGAPEPKRSQKQSTRVLPGDLAQHALQCLISLLDDISLADNDDALRSKYFWQIKPDTEILTNDSLIPLLDNLLRIYEDPIIQKIDIEVLTSIQKLCVKSLDVANSTAWNEMSDAIEKLALDNFNYLFICLSNHIYASKLMLLTLNGKRKDRVLFMDNYLKSVVNFLSAVIQDSLLPLTAKQISSIDASISIQKSLSLITTELSKILAFLCSSLNGDEIEEELLTKLEYLCIQIVFCEGNFNTKGLVSITTLSLAAGQVLVSIYQNYNNQRSFLLNEILSNFDKLPHQKNLARQVRLPRGGNIQQISVILLKMIQGCDTSNVRMSAKEFKGLNFNSKAAKSTIQAKRQNVIQSIDSLFQQAATTANEIANFFIKRLINNSDSNYKNSFVLFLDDMLNILTFPEWPGAETLSFSLLKSFLIVIQAGNQPAIMETFSLEMAGKIGHRLLEVKRATQGFSSLYIDSPSESLLALKDAFSDTLQYVRLQANKSKDFISAFRFLISKYITVLKPFSSGNGGERENQLEALKSDNEFFQQCLSNINHSDQMLDFLFQVLADDDVTSNQALNSDNDASSIESYSKVLLSQDLMSLYESFINTIVRSLDSNKIKLKSRAVKVLSSLIDQDPNLLLTPKIQESVSNNLLDGSPLVRDAVIDLISKYMSSRPALIDHFHKRICDRLGDDSISVRKRVIKLSREMYIDTSENTVRAYIAVQLLKRLEDEEDTMAEMARSFLLELWFGPLNKSSESTRQSSVLSRALVMMDIVSSGSKSAKLFQTFVSEFVLHGKDPEPKSIMKAISDCALDYILSSMDTQNQSNVEHAFILMASLVRCSGKLVSQDQLVILQPYLVDERNSSVSFYCLQILKNVLPECTALRPEFLESTQAYLLRSLTKFDVRELHQAMPSVWLLCKMRNNAFKLASASISCIRLLKPFLDNHQTKETSKMGPKLLKLLHLLGCFGSYCDFEQNRDLFMKANVGLKPNETTTSLITKFLLFFTDGSFGDQVRNVAIKNLMSVCTYHPKLFMSDSILRVLDKEFDGSSIEISHTIIQGMISFLNKEDEDAQQRNGSEVKSSKRLKLDVAIFHGESQSYVNDGICAGIIQRYIGKVLSLCICDSGKTSILPVQFLQLVLRLGFANPKICIPTIIALESSGNKYIKSTATQLHQELFEKHESLTDTSYLEGLRLAIKYQKQIGKGLLFRQSSHLKVIYEIVGRGYSSRKKFIQAVSKVFNLRLDIESFQDAIDQRDVIIYTIRNLSETLFVSVEDILIVISQIDKVISRQGTDQMDLIMKRQKNSCKTLEISCASTQALLAMLNFRSHLMNCYNISGAQIENYRPNRADIETRQAPKIATIVPFSLNNLELDIDVSSSSSSSVLFAKFIQAIKDYI